MESTGEGGGGGGDGLGLGFTEIETNAECLGPSEMFYIVKELIGFVLYMHHQIPSVLQHLEDEYDTLKDEYKGLESTSGKESKASLQRQHNMRKREVKSGIKKLEKLMNAISSVLSSLQQALDGTSNIHGVILVLGASPTRPQHVYEMFFPYGRVDSENATGCTKSKVAEALSRKAIRALISEGAGSCSYTGPTKLFLLVKSPCTFNLPLHFLPKRDFKYPKKTVPFKLRIKSKTHNEVVGDSHHTSEIGQSSSSDVIWYGLTLEHLHTGVYIGMTVIYLWLYGHVRARDSGEIVMSPWRFYLLEFERQSCAEVPMPAYSQGITF